MSVYRAFGCLILIEMAFGAPNQIEVNANYRVIRPVKSIPIRTMDSNRQRYMKAPPLNPDSELIFAPSQTQRFPYEKIMERLTAAPLATATTSNKSVNHHQRELKKNFNFLNFDAYLVRPMPVNYQRVFATVKPEAEKLLSAMNREDDDVSSAGSTELDANHSMFLSKDKSKSQTNNIRNPPTTINNADKRTHSNISTPKSDSFVEQSSNQYKRPQTQALISHANAANYVPTGMDFFESLWKQNLYQTITLPPPVSYDTQQFIASPPIPNKISRSFIEYDAEAMDTNQHEQTDKFIPQLDHSFYRGPSERMLPFEHTPHMIKFTLDDAIKRDNIDYENLTAVYGPGPVTVAPEGHQLFDPNLIDNQQPDVSEIYPEIRQMRQNFHSSHELSNDNMNLGELQMTSTGATTSKHPSTIAVKLPLPSKKLMARHGAPYRGHIKFGAKLKPFEKSQKFFDNKYSASNVNDELASNNWEPIATPSVISTGIPSMSDNPDIEITKENIVELMPDMFEENITPIIDHQQQTTTNQKKREHKDNTLEVSGVYSKQRHQGSSAETADIIYGYGKPQHIPFILNQPVGRIPKASITEYRAPTLYVPVRHHRPTIERHPDDVAFSPAKRLERIKSVSKPRADITKYFQYTNVFGNGAYVAGSRRGNDDHYIEQHERALPDIGNYMKRVMWGDKNGGYGEHLYDLNHHVSDDSETIRR